MNSNDDDDNEDSYICENDWEDENEEPYPDPRLTNMIRVQLFGMNNRDMFIQCRAWVYSYSVEEARFSTYGGTILHGQWYPSFVFFGSEDLQLLFTLSFPDLLRRKI